jgi:hypothetical protein
VRNGDSPGPSETATPVLVLPTETPAPLPQPQIKATPTKSAQVRPPSLAESLGCVAESLAEPSAPVNTTPWYTQQPLPLDPYDLYDLGITDANADGILDVFTSAHNAGQNLLISGPDGASVNKYDDWLFHQSMEFPGLEDTDQPIATDRSGIYLFWQNGSLHLLRRGLEQLGEITGNIQMDSNVKTDLQIGIDLQINSEKVQPRVFDTNIGFTFESEGEWVFRPVLNAVEISVEIAAIVPSGCISVGSRHINPKSNLFAFALQDRHGMAWADYDDSGHPDVYITRGGLRGRIGFLEGEYSDELMLHSNEAYDNVWDSAVNDKNDCRGTQAAWVDFDGDGLLDIYVGCNDSGNQLYRQSPIGVFTNVAQQTGLDITDSGRFRWFDVDGDGDMDMIYATSEHVLLYIQDADGFAMRPVFEGIDFRARSISVADYDNNGDQDIFIASKFNLLLANEGGTFVPHEPETIGLPRSSRAVAWVDYDNDGLTDLHSIPGGLYLQQPDHRFAAAGTLDDVIIDSPVDARVMWFDADNDGFRDLLAAVKIREDGPDPEVDIDLLDIDDDHAELDEDVDATEIETGNHSYWQFEFVENPGNVNNWLEIELKGPPGNSPAIGASVRVQTGSLLQTQLIGASESSHYSQGHYRLYFGLGVAPTVERITIIWPSGETQTLTNIAPNQVLAIAQTTNP